MKDRINSAQIVVPCADLNKTLDFFTKELGFRIEMISPADAPSTAVISGYGTTLRLEASNEIQPLTLRLVGDFSDEGICEIVSPDGVHIVFEDANSPLDIPDAAPELIVSANEDKWTDGRVGMQYRDLIPGHLGGRFVASHIRIADSARLLDYVHYHRIRFQMIFCLAGSAFVVYEDQGAPFLLKAGDCILQPPEIRHRVLECSGGFEVLEITCPAFHETFADHEMKLPNETADRERLFDGQHFLHDNTAEAVWKPAHIDGFEYRKTGMSVASGGLADVRVIRALADASFPAKLSGELLFFYVLKGSAHVPGEDGTVYKLETGASFTLPEGAEYAIEVSKDTELLRVIMPA